MTVRLKDIAKIVGVKPPTVSRVLNNKDSAIQVSEATKKKILDTARKLNYQPSAAAKALATNRTGYLGYIMSNTIEGGWQNACFARYLTGVENACRKHGYGLNICLYNLSNIDTFVMPDRIGQRSIDGLILTGYVEAAIVKKFTDFGIPLVVLGRDTEVEKLAPVIACDDAGGVLNLIKYCASMGHKHLLWHAEDTRRSREKVGRVLEQYSEAVGSHCKLSVAYTEYPCNYQAAQPFFDEWLKFAESERPSVIMSSDQTSVALVQELFRQNFCCPDAVSVVSVCDSRTCKDSNPPVVANGTDMEGQAEKAVEMLVEHLDRGKALTCDMSIYDYPCHLMKRKSCKNLNTKMGE